MSLLSIDPDKCKSDGICVAECPMGIIQMSRDGDVPEEVEGAEDLCIECGHCMAVCPHGALSLRSAKPEDLPSVTRQSRPNPEQAETFLRFRRSIRSYKDKPVEREKLENLIEMASYAPSGHNSQPVKWLVIESKEEMKRIAGLVIEWMRFMLKNNPEIAKPLHMDRVTAAWERGQDRALRGAPHLVVAHANSTLAPSQAACVIAVTYLELAAPSLGLGTCWAGYFNAAANFYPPLSKYLDLPDKHLPFGAAMVGYPKYAYHRLPSRKRPTITWR